MKWSRNKKAAMAKLKEKSKEDKKVDSSELLNSVKVNR